jgi:hypothetical protein
MHSTCANVCLNCFTNPIIMPSAALKTGWLGIYACNSHTDLYQDRLDR